MQNVVTYCKVFVLTILIMPLYCTISVLADCVSCEQPTHNDILAAETQQSTVSEPKWRTRSSLGAKPKYAEDFRHYDYVNPNARKGGTLNTVSTGTFNNFNAYIAEGVSEKNLSLIYDTLMKSSSDELSVNYPLIATALQYPDDFSWVKYKIRNNATFHDGTPITPEDVIWSFEILKQISPSYSYYYSSVKSAQLTAKDEVTFVFSMTGNRELPHILGQLPILPKHWWLAKDANGQQRDISKPLREIPLGSGPYRLDSYNLGKTSTYKRVENYWGKDLPVNVGRNNFDIVRNTYYLNENASWEAFKKGGIADYRQETSIHSWIKKYNFPAVTNGFIQRESFDFKSIGRMNGYFLNTRREKFADIRVRKALTIAFDFTQVNNVLFFNQYERISSYFHGLDFVSAQILPIGKELQLLETVKDEIPNEVFAQPFTLPSYNNPTELRKNLSEAMRLLHDAGWRLNNNQLVNKKGEVFKIEILLDNTAFERPTALYIANLKRLGIDVVMRTVDAAQYQNRIANYDYDIISSIIGQSDSPGNEQLYYFGSAVVDRVGGKNYAGIKNPAIDKMIAAIISAKDRDDLIAAVRAMDRILLWNYYVVPQWTSKKINIAYWNKFDIPRPQPAASGIDIYSWSVNPQKEQALRQRISSE